MFRKDLIALWAHRAAAPSREAYGLENLCDAETPDKAAELVLRRLTDWTVHHTDEPCTAPGPGL
jgi:hypothetical protein